MSPYRHGLSWKVGKRSDDPEAFLFRVFSGKINPVLIETEGFHRNRGQQVVIHFYRCFKTSAFCLFLQIQKPDIGDMDIFEIVEGGEEVLAILRKHELCGNLVLLPAECIHEIITAQFSNLVDRRFKMTTARQQREKDGGCAKNLHKFKNHR